MPISEREVENVLAKLEGGEILPEDTMAILAQSQPFLARYLVSETGSILNETEKEIHLFLLSVVWNSLETDSKDILKGESIEDADEFFWGMLSENRNLTITQKMDPFFEHLDEEEILAVIEDTLSDVEDEHITGIGREWILVSLATMIELLR